MKGLKGYTYLETTKIQCTVVGVYLAAHEFTNGVATVTRLVVLYKGGTFGDIEATSFFTTSL